jgi:hypothetical protein
MACEPRANELEWINGVLKCMSDEIGFEICRRMTEFRPLGYRIGNGYDTMRQRSEDYNFQDPVSGFKAIFIPLSTGELEQLSYVDSVH